jgi:hypothetical protein
MKSIFIALLIGSWSLCASAQTDSLLDELSEPETKLVKKELVKSTFKATRIINSSSVEHLAPGVLDFRISHRFGRINEGFETFFGIDEANTRLGLDYGITKFLMIGLGHSVLNKENDGFVKVKLLGQREHGTPVSVGYYAGMSLQRNKAPILAPGQEYYYRNRLAYFHQLLIARKFNESISLQLMPSLLHVNLVDSSKYDNTIFALGVAGRVKLTKRIAMTGEYFYRFTGQNNTVAGQKTYNSLSVGFDIETGGHVFQLHFTNTPGISERVVLGQTTDSWASGNMHYGFNISRVFTIVKPKEYRKGATTW